MNNSKRRKKQLDMIAREITDQLDAQGISYKLLTTEELIELDVETKWKAAFIGKRTAPYLEQCKWHILSYDKDYGIKRAAATQAYLKQYPAEMIIFNERLEYGIMCERAEQVPRIVIEKFYDDVYICHRNMKWTYVIPHERSTMGPYFLEANSK